MRLPRIALPLAIAALAVSCHSKTELTEVRVMTWNLDVGIGLDALFAQTSVSGFMQQAEIAWHQKDQSDFGKRVHAIADAIEAARPDLVGLQEVAQYFSGPIGGPATTPAQDFLVLLLAELHGKGLDYAVASDGTTQGVVTNADVEVTGADANGNPTADYRVVDREVVLARSGVGIAHVRTGNYAARIDVPVPGATTFPYKRGWVAVDAAVGGKAFTFLSTHLDAFDPRVQGEQAHELLALLPPGAPSIVVGDMNSDPTDTAWPANGILVSTTTGLSDTGADVGATAPTCCYDELCSVPPPPANEPYPLTRRVDHVYHSQHFSSESATRFGATAADFSPTYQLWPADHAGVSATVGLE